MNPFYNLGVMMLIAVFLMCVIIAARELIDRYNQKMIETRDSRIINQINKEMNR